jgi:hypothetical protein
VLTTDGDDTLFPAASLHVRCHSCRPSDISWVEILPLVMKTDALADISPPSLLFM